MRGAASARQSRWVSTAERKKGTLARCSRAREPAPGRPDSAFGQRLGGGLRPNEFAGAPPTARRCGEGCSDASWGAGWQGRVSGQGAPRLLPPPLRSALVRVKPGGAGGAALTSLRAVPAREGGAEPLRARRSGAPPGAPAPPPPRLPLAALGHATVRAAAPGRRPELGRSLGTRLILGDRTTVTATAPPPPSPRGVPAPSRLLHGRSSSFLHSLPRLCVSWLAPATKEGVPPPPRERTRARVRRREKRKESLEMTKKETEVLERKGVLECCCSHTITFRLPQWWELLTECTSIRPSIRPHSLRPCQCVSVAASGWEGGENEMLPEDNGRDSPSHPAQPPGPPSPALSPPCITLHSLC
ncbi:uncharacterized protein LOC128123949 [Peromyscus californicus insignis]|uniref:uncharacterized protein LOC128123949 n=1 Tax=Peromyscus californicus insignis TaxID=564181 RepID=UPI0022A71FCC|nr:uncharacterized protein LOC128123949 [Peromyscus californicus insignis]